MQFTTSIHVEDGQKAVVLPILFSLTSLIHHVLMYILDYCPSCFAGYSSIWIIILHRVQLQYTAGCTTCRDILYIVTLSKLKNVLLLTLQAVIFSAAVVTTKDVNYYIISQLRTYFVLVLF